MYCWKTLAGEVAGASTIEASESRRCLFDDFRRDDGRLCVLLLLLLLRLLLLLEESSVYDCGPDDPSAVEESAGWPLLSRSGKEGSLFDTDLFPCTGAGTLSS